MFCQKCGYENETKAQFCAGCGKVLGKSTGGSSRKWIFTGIFICLAVLVGVGYTLVQVWPSDKFAFIKDHSMSGKIEQLIKKEPTDVQRIDSGPNSKEKTAIIQEAMPKVFTIFTEESLGSGFLYKKGGLIVTNAHVVAGYTNVIVRNSDGKDTAGKVIGISDRYDIALIHAKDYAKVEPLAIELDESIIGSEVIAIGSPQGFENTASIGYLTGIGRNIEYDFIYENIYQIDAQIDQGSSGGPLLEAKTGKVIGVNSLLYKGNTSFGFSIPMYSVMSLVDGWAKNPMTEHEVASLFGVYDDYVYYDESMTDEISTYYEEYWKDYDWDDYEGYEEEYTEDEYEYEYDGETDEIEPQFVDVILEDFVLAFRDHYEKTLHDETFYWIEDMLLPGSTAYTELQQYVSEISGQGMTFDFLDNTVANIVINGETAIVSTYEIFDFIANDGEVTHYEREKDYTLIINEYGAYQIINIEIR
ncbi:trypsin-like peptidase domain-containing protein [Sporosarcina sp. FSL K6-1522]|uniref:trypsin-like peptidase domain-containing protein n=1 Tax=Sporosarcina sp. FSL K6-1522 TaxID=2921554 RepID=UPI00315AC0C2